MRTHFGADCASVTLRPPDEIRPTPRNARTHSRKQIGQIEDSIREFGFVNPVLVDEEDVLIAGHGRLQAALNLGLETIPVIELHGLSDMQKRKLLLADNRIAQNAGWDRELLAIELEAIVIDGGDITLTGFEVAEVDEIILDHEQRKSEPADELPDAPHGPIITRPGDLWLLGRHRILCGDALDREALDRLCGEDMAAMMFTDPPYNLRIADIVGRGKRKYQEFQMASGEMSAEGFAAFLQDSLALASGHSTDGAVHFVCMDWRHVDQLLQVCRGLYGAVLNIVVWVKSNAGQGSFYRSQHELIAVVKVGDGRHRNNIELGRHGRNRSNVWHYAGVNSFRKGRLDELTVHPTVKPVAMIADAIRDCTTRGDFVLDVFGGSGSTLLACEKVGRSGLLLEIEPRYVDVTIERWQKFTGRDAVHAVSGLSFDEMRAELEESPGCIGEEKSND